MSTRFESSPRTSESLKSRSLKGLLWTSCESFGVAALSLAVFAVMAHILRPADFGVFALAGVFIFSFNLIAGSSFSDALVQRKDLMPDHADVAFWSTLGMALAFTGLCYAGAAPAARLFNEPRLANLLPWLAWIMPLSAIGSVQTALFRRSLRFRTVAAGSAAGRAIGAAIGVCMALSGFGVWSLVGQQIAGAATTGIAMAVASAWRPHFRFSFARFRELWGFGFHVSASHTINGLSEQSVKLLVGSLFGAAVLGYFSIAWRMIQLVSSLTGNAVYHVAFAAFSRLQENRAATAQATLQATRLSCLFGFPVGAGIALLSGPIIFLLFGHNWDKCVPLLTLLAIGIIPSFYAMFFSACYRAMGRPGWALALSLLYAVSGIAAILLLAPLGISMVAVAWVGRSFLLLPVPLLLLRRILGIPMTSLLAPILPPAAATTIMTAAVGALVWSIGNSIGNAEIVLAAALVGALTYVAAIALLSPDLARVATRTVTIMVAPSRIPQTR